MSFFGRLMSLDATLSAALVPDESKHRLQSFLKIIGHSCDSWYWLIGLIVFWIFAAGEARAKAFLLAFILGVLAVFVHGIKFVLFPVPKFGADNLYLDLGDFGLLFPCGSAFALCFRFNHRGADRSRGVLSGCVRIFVAAPNPALA